MCVLNYCFVILRLWSIFVCISQTLEYLCGFSVWGGAPTFATDPGLKHVYISIHFVCHWKKIQHNNLLLPFTIMFYGRGWEWNYLNYWKVLRFRVGIRINKSSWSPESHRLVEKNGRKERILYYLRCVARQSVSGWHPLSVFRQYVMTSRCCINLYSEQTVWLLKEK